MSIAYSGVAPTWTTFTQSAGTRGELASWISDQLILAGWTLDAGATTDRTLKSALTPQNLQCRVRSYDPGSGNCARLKWSNPAASRTQTGDVFLLPAAGKTWLFLGGKYQFAVYTAQPSVAREFAMGGVPWLPSFLSGVLTEAIWWQGNAGTDTDATVRASFRSRLDAGAGGALTVNTGVINQGVTWEATNVASAVGCPMLLIPHPSDTAAVGNGYRWHDGSIVASDPLMTWGLTAKTDEGKVKGMLWDAFLLSETFTGDAPLTFDGHTWIALTDGNSGSGSSGAKGTLALATN